MTGPIVHPSWCQRETCRVRPAVRGVPIGAHRSRPVVIGGQEPGELEVRFSLWQIEGRPVHVSVDWNRPDDVPVDGFLLDLDEAKVVGRVLRDLAAMAAREETR